MSSQEGTTVPVEELNKLQSDFDALEKDHETLKTEHETLTTERDELQEKYKDVDLDEVQGVRDKLAAFVKAEKDQAVKGILAKAKDDAWSARDILRRLYWNEKLSLAQVAEKLGSVSGAWPKPCNKTPRLLHRSTICKWMQALGIPRRKRAYYSSSRFAVYHKEP